MRFFFNLYGAPFVHQLMLICVPRLFNYVISSVEEAV